MFNHLLNNWLLPAPCEYNNHNKQNGYNEGYYCNDNDCPYPLWEGCSNRFCSCTCATKNLNNKMSLLIYYLFVCLLKLVYYCIKYRSVQSDVLNTIGCLKPPTVASNQFSAAHSIISNKRSTMEKRNNNIDRVVVLLYYNIAVSFMKSTTKIY